MRGSSKSDTLAPVMGINLLLFDSCNLAMYIYIDIIGQNVLLANC
jgi:hypothetical protein